MMTLEMLEFIFPMPHFYTRQCTCAKPRRVKVTAIFIRMIKNIKALLKMDAMEEGDIACEEVIVSSKRKKKTGSKILKRLMHILHEGLHEHVIQFTNPEKTEFQVKFVDKKNKKIWNERILDLFLDLDSVSSKDRNTNKAELAKETKTRFKSNMRKFVKAGYLKEIEKNNESKTVMFLKYRIFRGCPFWDEEEAYFQRDTKTNFKDNSKENAASSGGSPAAVSSYNNTSHYSCLSRQSERGEQNNMPLIIILNINNPLQAVNQNLQFNNGSVGNGSEDLSDQGQGNTMSANYSISGIFNNGSVGNGSEDLSDQGQGNTMSANYSISGILNDMDDSFFEDCEVGNCLKNNSKDPLLSTTVELEKHTGLSPRDDWLDHWQNVPEFASFNEDMFS